MSTLNPEKLPVKVYKWSDSNAPALDKSANSMATIFKACLVTGYSGKAGAGWTMPFEDIDKGVKVFRPPISVEQDFYLRVSQDDGKTMLAQVYTSMSDINTGELKLQLNTPFIYANFNITGKWLMVVSPRGFWFFCEQYMTSSQPDKSGAYFFVGDTAKNSDGFKNLWLAHTSGVLYSWMYQGVIQSSGNPDAYSAIGKMFDTKTLAVTGVKADSMFDSATQQTREAILSNLMLFDSLQMYVLPSIYTSSSGAIYKNFNKITTDIDGELAELVCFSTGSNTNTNYFIRTDEWVY